MSFLATIPNTFFDDPFLFKPMELFNKFTTNNMNELIKYAEDKKSDVLSSFMNTDIINRNVYSLKNGNTRHEFSVPGYSKDNLKVKTVTGNDNLEYLVIEGSRQLSDEVDSVMSKSTKNSISLKVSLPSRMKVVSVDVKNGLLEVDLKKKDEDLNYIEWI